MKKRKKRYDNKYDKSVPEYQENDLVRIKKFQTETGLKKKLRNEIWSEPYKITKVLSKQNVEISDLDESNRSKRVVNVNNIKKKEPDRKKRGEFIRSGETITRFGRISKPRNF